MRSGAELGTHKIRLTKAGQSDPVFGRLPVTFTGHMGHEDRVTTLPAGAKLLASTDRVENQAFCFEGKPIYCTQFHPELDKQSLVERLRAYPRYVEQISGLSVETFADQCKETPDASQLISRFATHVLGLSPA